MTQEERADKKKGDIVQEKIEQEIETDVTFTNCRE